MLARDYVIIQDTREKLPLLFPEHLAVLDPRFPFEERQLTTVRLHVVKQQLPTADYGIAPLQEGEGRYVLEGARQSVLIERKRNLDEIATNCLDPKRRALFVAELERMRAGWSHPILFLEGDHAAYLRPTARNPEPALALDAFLSLVTAYHLPVHLLRMTTPDLRRATGEWAARLLIRGALANGRTSNAA